MTDTTQAPLAASPLNIPGRAPPPLAATQASAPTAPVPSSLGKGMRNGHLTLDTFSPVNQNGSFEFDRVLKSGVVQKRTRKTKAWKSVYLVLRPNLLSIYKSPKETKLRHQLNLSDLTAVAALKDRKRKRQHVFGLFSPSRNYHMEAASEADLAEWVELIRQEARIDEEEQEISLVSPGGQNGSYRGFERHVIQASQKREGGLDERLGSSSPEPGDLPSDLPIRTSKTRDGVRIPGTLRRPSSHVAEFSGNEVGSYSDLSDTIVEQSYKRGSSISLNQPEQDLDEIATSARSGNPPIVMLKDRPAATKRNLSQLSGFDLQDEERVVWQGYLLCLNSKRGVRQWKKVWAVLRLKNLALYKNEDEYKPTLILPLSSIINAVEIDPISKTKNHCMQVIAEEKSYRFCAADETALDKWLGALKSLLARRREKERGKAALETTMTASPVGPALS